MTYARLIRASSQDDLTALSARSGRLLQLIDLAQPVCDAIPTDAVLVHHPSLGPYRTHG
jgi:hypothetical protein